MYHYGRIPNIISSEKKNEVIEDCVDYGAYFILITHKLNYVALIAPGCITFIKNMHEKESYPL